MFLLGFFHHSDLPAATPDGSTGGKPLRYVRFICLPKRIWTAFK
jgi:hypothetical protein